MPKKYTYQYIKEYIEKENYQLLSDTYKNNNTKLLLKCPIGHEYKVTLGSFQQGRRCPFCAGNIKLTYEYVKYFIESKGYQLLSDTYINSKTKLLIKCPIGHEYNVLFLHFKNGIRCPVCYGNKKLTYEYVKSYIEKEGYQLLSKKYKNNSTELLLKCPEGHGYKVKFYSFKQGCRCPICWNESKSSKDEKELQDYIETLGYNIIRNDRTQIFNPLTGYNLELDIWIPDLKKAIEYNGTYWHSLKERKINDAIKKDQCKKLSIDLLIVNEASWIKNKQKEIEQIKKWLNNH